jgi:hypothetical protein
MTRRGRGRGGGGGGGGERGGRRSRVREKTVVSVRTLMRAEHDPRSSANMAYPTYFLPKDGSGGGGGVF